MKQRFTVKLDDEYMEKLRKLSRYEMRDFREQAAWIIIRYLRNELLWKDDIEKPEIEWIP